MMVLSGARAGEWNWLRRLTARAAARDLTVFVVPGLEIARAHGLDLAAAELRPVATPRHATVLIVVGELPTGLCRAAAIAWAQMPRPRAILALGAGALDPLPGADVAVPLGQAALVGAVAEIRRRVVDGAFGQDVTDFDVAAVRTATTYTCPMHPEIVRDEPGQCPICGMDLVTREEAGGTDHENQTSDATHGIAHQGEHHGGHAGGVGEYTCPMHAEVAQDDPGSCPICGMDLVPRDEDTARGAAKDGDETPEGEGGIYTCPMHPEIMRAEQGQCPLCGMDLVPRDENTNEGGAAAGDMVEGKVRAYTCPMHPEIARDEPGSCPRCGMDLIPRAAANADHDADNGDHGRGEAPDRQAEPGGLAATDGHPHAGHQGHGDQSAPGASGERQASAAEEPGGEGDMAHGEHSMGGMDHGDEQGGHPEGDMGGMDMGEGFMSMVMMTHDLVRSADGLPMERLDVPFGPLFPGLPGGLALTFSLDGDTVAEASVTRGVLARGLDATWPGPVATLPERFARLDPLAPLAYRLLAQRAVGAATAVTPDEATVRARIGALERERAASHLNWLAAFLALLGDRALAREAAGLQRALLTGPDSAAIARQRPGVTAFVRRVLRRPLLARRLRGVGALGTTAAPPWGGPVARSAGVAEDTRADERAYRALGFVPVVRSGADAWARLAVRLAELDQSVDLVIAAGAVALPAWTAPAGDGSGQAIVETPRGAATLRLTIAAGMVREAALATPSVTHLAFLKPVAAGCEVADALVGIASLDLSPWEIER